MVQRYELKEMSRNPFESYRCLEDSEEGDWVSYEDYAALQQTLAAARTYVNDAAKTDAHAFGLLQAINKALKND